MTMRLAELQATMQQALLGDARAARRIISKPAADTVDRRIGIYRNAFYQRHEEFLAIDHPALLAYVGGKMFRKISRAYARATRQAHVNARWYSRGLPAFIAGLSVFARNPEIAELALLERALNDAFDAPDVPLATLEELAAIDPSRFAATVFELSPSLSVLRLATNAAPILASLKADTPPPQPELLRQRQAVVVYRQGYASHFRLAEEEEAMALDAARQGTPFGVVCEMIAMHGGGETATLRAAGYLRGWIDCEILSSLRAPARRSVKYSRSTRFT